MSVFPEPIAVVDPADQKITKAPCPRCGVKLEPEFMEIHLQNHSKERPYACDMCDFTCDAKSKLETHLRSHTGEKPFKCEVCPSRFTQYINMVTHMKIHSNKYTCPSCNMTFNYYKSLKKHEQSMLCPGRTGGSSTTAESVSNTEDDEEPLDVKVDHVFSSTDYGSENTETRLDDDRQPIKVETKVEESSHSPPSDANVTNSFNYGVPGKSEQQGYHRTTHICKICLAPFISAPLLNNHVLTCSIENVPFHCQQCPRKFKKSHGLDVHMLRAHGVMKNANKPVKVKVTNGEFDCKICSRKFASRASLKIHTNWHGRAKTTERKADVVSPNIPVPSRASIPLYKCNVCSNSFASFRAMRVHQSRAHTGHVNTASKASSAPTSPWSTNKNYNFQCQVCDKKFETPRALKTHSMYHQDKNNQPYVCHKCGKNFNGFRALRIHEAYHSADKTMLQCGACDKSFPGLRALRLHTAVHRASRGVYQCRTCTKFFCTYRALKVHESYHRFRATQQCQFCDKKFDKFGMRAHLMWHRRAGIDTSRPGINSGSNEMPQNSNLVREKHLPKDREVPSSSKIDPIDCTTETIDAEQRPTKVAPRANILNSFTCRQCFKQFRVRSALMVHLHTHRMKKRRCEFCPDKWFRSLLKYSKHMELHQHMVYPTTKSSDGITTAEKTSPAQIIYQCRLCPKRFRTPKSLAMHKSWHKRHQWTRYMQANNDSVSTHSCRKCTLTFENVKQLQDHITAVHREVTGTFQPVKSPFIVPTAKRKRTSFRCANCNAVFTTKGLLYQHKRSACTLTEQDLQAQASERQRQLFLSADQDLVKHASRQDVSPTLPQSSQTVQKVYQCPKCPKRFTSSWGLKYHSSAHNPPSTQEEPKRQFKCSSCSMVFLGRSLLQAHRKEVHNKSVESCTSISSSSTHSLQLQELSIEYDELKDTANTNIQMKSPTAGTLACRKCPKVFKNIKGLGGHLSLKHKLRYACKQCMQSYNSYIGLYYHNIKQHQFEISDPEELYKSVVQGMNSCTKCLTTFATPDKLARHMHSKHTSPPIPSSQPTDLKPKKRQKSKIQRHYQCELCMMEYRSYNGLKHHKEIMHKGCPVSDNEHMNSYLVDTSTTPEKRMDEAQYSRKPSSAHVGDDEVKPISQTPVLCEGELQSCYPCSMCPKVFSGKQYLNNHLRTHFEPRSGLNDKVSFRVVDSSNGLSNDDRQGILDKKPTELVGSIGDDNIYSPEHSKTSDAKTNPSARPENGNSSPPSPLPDSSTTAEPLSNTPATELSAASITDKLYNCTYCSYSTFSLSNLTQHSKIHLETSTNERPVGLPKSNHVPVDCPICGKRLSCKSALSTHMRIHTGAKPFSCDTCGESFTYKQMLQRHAQRVHGINLVATEITKTNQWSHSTFKHLDPQETPSSTDSDEQVNALLKIAEAAVAKPSSTSTSVVASNQPVFPREEAVNQPVFPTLYKCDQCSGLFQVESDLIHHKMVHEQKFQV